MYKLAQVWFFCILAVTSTTMLKADGMWEEIKVEAGSNQTLCQNELVELSTLGASISGIVDDGNWFTSGDGQFVPNKRFSEATTYIPGPNDKANGSFHFILVSDDPDGDGPKTEKSDYVFFNFMSAPPILCNGNLNIPLNETCQLQILPIHVLSNPQPPYDKYTIVLRDENNNVILDDIITAEHVGQVLTYTSGHDCTQSVCSGTLTVMDNIGPALVSKDTMLSCFTPSMVPDSLGFPVPAHARIVKVDSVTYQADSIDACGMVTLRYADSISVKDCPKDSLNIIQHITRTWTGTDEHGNASTSVQHIRVRAAGLDTIVLPPNFDNTDSISFSCNATWPALDSGFPSPDTTGFPKVYSCSNFHVSYSDTKVDMCGAGYRVLRKWRIIDWCTNDDISHNQLILVEDREGPRFNCPDSLTFLVDPYDCLAKGKSVPQPVDVEDCSNWEYSLHLFDPQNNDVTIVYVQGTTLDKLPVGQYKLEYRLQDACGNKNSCFSTVSVIDNYAPYVSCKTYTTASINEEGNARVPASSYDNGSHDNCGIAIMEVARMDQGDDLKYREYVDFFCEDVGKTIMVNLRVTDASGNVNTCMVETRVEDKLKPVLVCPSDITISCMTSYDPEDLSSLGKVRHDSIPRDSIRVNGEAIGRDGYFSDNCGVRLIESDSSSIHCGKGHIYRTFIVIDTFGNSDTCMQTITIQNDRPFTKEMIIWPSDTTMIGCDTLDAVVSKTGSPELGNGSCGLAESTYEDQVFTIEEGACVKILRKWTVIDWCNYESDGTQGIWKHTQQIKLINTEAPVILNCQDTVLCSTSENCERSLVSLSISATDDCTKEEHIRYSWALDTDNDGSYDQFGQGKNFEEVLTYGAYTIRWRAEDGCGNSSFCEQKFTTSNCKKPTPVCLEHTSTVLMPSSKSLTIRAANFNHKSYDNCTADEDLIYSFSSDTSYTTRTITCEDIVSGIEQDIVIEMWVTDSDGNQDFCTITLHIADNDDVCPDNPAYTQIAGTLKTHTGTVLDSVEVRMTAMGENKYAVRTDSDGGYKFRPVPKSESYHIIPSIKSLHSLGINTRDLILLQRHMLKLDTLKTVYNYLAGDVNNDGKITPYDLFLIRRAILDKDWKFEAGIDGWSFIATDTDFSKYAKIYDVDEGIYVESGKQIDNFDMVAVKIGDVNGSIDSKLSKLKRRNSESIEITARPVDGGYALYLPKGRSIEALQMELASDRHMTVESSFIKEEALRNVGDTCRFVHILDKELGDNPLIYVYTEGNLELTKSGFDSEVYTRDADLDIELVIGENGPSDAVHLYPNPFYDLVYYEQDRGKGPVTLEVFSVYGERVYTGTFSDESHTVDLSHLKAGVYYMYLVDENGHKSYQKMVKAH